MASRYHMMDILRRQLEVGSTAILYRTKHFHTRCVCGALSPSAAAEVHIVDPQSLSFGNVSDKLLRESFWCVLMGVRGIDQPADVDSWEQTVEQTERFSGTVARVVPISE